jgi:hypothetical protein
MILIPAKPMMGQAATGTIRGQIADPSGAVIPQAVVTIASSNGQKFTATSDNSGAYEVRGLAPGGYTVGVVANGFAAFNSSSISLTAGQVKRVDVALAIEVEKQQVTVTDETPTVSLDPGSNANALIIKDKDLDALSDDPDELSSELTALAGPSAGPNGGQIYIDGFTAGQLPPKSAIREIRVNQNPFSAEYDKLGFGRIEILTKPGTEKLHGQFFVNGNSDIFNSKNPFARQIPAYHTLQYDGNVSSAINKRASFFFNFDRRDIQDNNIVTAILNGNSATCDPNTVDYSTYVPNATPCSLAVPNPRTRTNLSPRLDFQLGERNTLTVRYQFFKNTQRGNGAGQFALPSQAFNEDETEHTVQISDTQVLTDKIVNETRLQYIHNPDSQTPVSTDPTVQVQGAFTSGGYSDQTVSDRTNRYELQNYTSIAMASHFLKFGARLRYTRDANDATSNFNGFFTFGQRIVNGQTISALQSYQITRKALAQNPNPSPEEWAAIQAQGGGASQYTLSTGKPSATVNLFDIGLYLQDDWKVRPNFSVSYGLRYETQDEISDHADFAPRVSLAYGLSRNNKPAKTVIRAGYGIFYDRFQIAQVLQASRLNGNTSTGQVQFVVQNPDFFGCANGACPVDGSATTGTIYQIAPHLRAPYTMQAAVGVDQQVTKYATISVTYLNSRGDHQLITRNVNAPFPDVPGTTGPRPNPNAGNIYQYDSAAIFKQNQLIVNVNLRVSSSLSLFGFYQLGYANSETGGVTTFPSNQYDLAQDYGRASFDVRNRLFLGGSYATPRLGIRFSPFLVASSGAPFNIVTSQDLNGDSIFNDRPAYASTSSTTVVQTKYGSFDSNPQAGSKPIPINVGNGPSQFTFNLRASKTFGIGPKLEKGESGPGIGGGGGGPGGGPGGGRGMGGAPGGGLGPGGLSGNRGGPPPPGGASGRRYNLTFNVSARNLFNNVNLAPPVGTVDSPLFGKSNALGGAFGGVSQSANRRIDLQLVFNF